jgi:hypothetical protein
VRIPHAIVILRERELQCRMSAQYMFKSRHDKVVDLAIKIDVIRSARKQAEALRLARKALGDDYVVEPEDLKLFQQADKVIFGNKRWGRDYVP